MDQLSDRIKKIREEMGVSQIVFASFAGVHRAHLSKIERGKANPSNRLIKDLSSALGVREEWLRTGRGEKGVEAELSPETVRAFEKELKEIQYEGAISSLRLQNQTIQKFIKWVARLQKGKKEEIELSKENQKVIEFQTYKKDLLKNLKQYQALITSLFTVNSQKQAKNEDSESKKE